MFVSSETHRDVGSVDFHSLGRFTPYDAMGSMKVYGYSKLLLEVYAADLARRLGKGASVHSLCPGAVDTDIAREAPDWVKPVLGAVMKTVLSRPPRGRQAGDVPVLRAGAGRPNGMLSARHGGEEGRRPNAGHGHGQAALAR